MLKQRAQSGEVGTGSLQDCATQKCPQPAVDLAFARFRVWQFGVAERSDMISEVLLWLFAINLGVVVGAGLYEHRIVVPLWASAPPESFGKPEVGLRFWLYATTIPLTFLALANVLAAWMHDGPARIWWLAATLIVVAERIATFTYFVPTLLALQNEQSSAPGAMSRFARWRAMNLFRNVAAIAAWLAALKALTILV